MNKYSVINLKTDPDLKQSATKAAEKLGISISAVLNNELRRFAAEQSVIFELPEAPNTKTARILARSRKEIEAGEYHRFDDNGEALSFLSKELG